MVHVCLKSIGIEDPTKRLVSVNKATCLMKIVRPFFFDDYSLGVWGLLCVITFAKMAQYVFGSQALETVPAQTTDPLCLVPPA